jgi:hypothetical protein
MAHAQELAGYIATIVPIPFNEVTDPVVIDQKRATTVIDGVECTVAEITRRQTLAFDDMVAFDPNADALWPGSMVQGKALRDGMLAPIALPRAPLSITITTPLGLRVTSREVERPSLASVTDAVRALLEPVDAATPARLSFHCSSASSLEQGMLSMGCDIKWLGGSARSDVSARASGSRSLIVGKLMQAYLTVASAAPASPAALFGKTVTLADLAPYAGEGNPPAYVSSVTFGRALLFVFQSAASASDLQASVNAAFSGAVSGTADVGAHHKSVLESSQMQVLAIGGSARRAADVIAGGRLEAIRAYVLEGANFSRTSPGVAISFQARYLCDNSTAGMALSSSWTQRTISARDVDVDVDVGPRSGLVDTGIMVREGDTVVLVSKGEVWSGVLGTFWCDGQGWHGWKKPSGTGFPMMDKHPFSLVGRINEPWFYIGTGVEHRHQGAAGTLKLSINTNNHGVGDGTLKVTGKVRRRTEHG